MSANTKSSPWMETENVIINNIMSGVNACGTLKGLVAKATDEKNPDAAPLVQFLRGAIRGGNVPRAKEDMQEDADFAAVRASEEAKREFCEFVASNLGAGVRVEEHAKDLFENAFRRALPGRQI